MLSKRKHFYILTEANRSSISPAADVNKLIKPLFACQIG